ncbi:serine protease inhibitor [Streptomyces sp. WAC08241]|uniref:serine protease inhibitor n=1 Tax=Streptomyces sp. WAC08241 TaxID=2487421 RepID=UPI0021B037D8|nr:serine protease inhibitor [Streptomyces sp. WAC08241]
MLLAALAAASATALIAPAVATAAPETATATAVPAVLDATALPGARTTDPAGTRTQWPETLGLPKAWAEKVILRDRPDLRVVHVPEGALVTMEYDENRVRIVHDAFGLVTQVPTIG